MNFESSILEALKAGKTVDELASEYSKALNEAVKRKEEEDAKAKASVKKIEDMDVILDLIDEFIYNYYPEYKDIVNSNVESKTVIELLDETFPLLEELNKGIEDLTKMFGIDKEECACCKPKEKTVPFSKTSSKDMLSAKDVDKVINDFMKKMGL